MRKFSVVLATSAVMASVALADANSDYLAANAKKPGVTTTASGLQYKVVKSGGHGVKPRASDCVSVYYKGNLVNGTVFDQTQAGHPASFPVNRVIRGWTEALQMMRTGDEWELTIPSGLAYGETGTPGGPIPPNATLVFDVTLLKVTPQCN
jgi:FKBP-type peptidyl-prolyl cis-trans isomerase FklB